MAQWLRTLAVLAEDLGSVLSTDTAAHHVSVILLLMPFLMSAGTRHMAHT